MNSGAHLHVRDRWRMHVPVNSVISGLGNDLAPVRRKPLPEPSMMYG